MGDVWRARAVKPGQAGDGALLLEHQPSTVRMEACECEQPAFVDCEKPPFRGPRTTKVDPIVFENHAGLPVDLFWWNGTCEELISWDQVGGVQDMQSKPVHSTQGHTFRIRNAFTHQLLMQHTLSDVVIRGCDDGSASEVRAGAELESLRVQTAALAAEHRELHEKLAFELASLVSALEHAVGNRSAAAAGYSSWQPSTSHGSNLLGVSALGASIRAASPIASYH